MVAGVRGAGTGSFRWESSTYSSYAARCSGLASGPGRSIGGV
jgi:hypothetical protein